VGVLEVCCAAIRNRRMLSFVYSGEGVRRLEPHIVWEAKDGTLMLDGWQRTGRSKSQQSTQWRRFRLQSMSDVRLEAATFAGPRQVYEGKSKRYKNVVCRI
jgi:hypothetical protein